MTLNLLIDILCKLGLKENLCNFAAAGPSIYAINPSEIKDYPVLFISPTERIDVQKNLTKYGLTVYYIDRLLSDRSNEIQIYSVAADTLNNFINQVKALDGVVDVSVPSIRLFTQSEKMQDMCAGGYTTITITVLNTMNCPSYF